MRKAILITSTAFILAGVAPAFAKTDAQEKLAIEHTDSEQRHAPRFSIEDRAAFTAARIAALKAGLQLKPDQEAHWAAVETALHTAAQERTEQRAQHREKHSDHPRPDALEILNWRAENLRNHAERLSKIAAASKPLFNSLSEAQKRRFSILLRESLDGDDRFASQRQHSR